tara:strand:- start:1105 stop:1314 length:210 start_codon:yes stop_codon:yes gene_type:complete
MSYSKSKNTKRFNFGIRRDARSHKAGANTFTIGTRIPDTNYSTSSSQITMTVKEARALQGFLNQHLDNQ